MCTVLFALVLFLKQDKVHMYFRLRSDGMTQDNLLSHFNLLGQIIHLFSLIYVQISFNFRNIYIF